MGKKKKKKSSGKQKKSSLNIEISGYDYHLPVMLHRTVDYLVTAANGTYIDCTLGGGGHTAEILSRLDTLGKVIAYDKDEEAIAHCSDKFRGELSTAEPRVILINDSYVKACSISVPGGIRGILLDLGLSSHQLDEGERGFSFRKHAPIDMRFGMHGKSAEALLNAASEDELRMILRHYGEEPFSNGIARRIVEVRRVSPIRFTTDLVNIIESVIYPRFVNKTLPRVFQAIRIAVNDELAELQNLLSNIIPVLASGGRIVVISYHSLEDRIVKTFFRNKSKRQRTIAPNDIYANTVPETEPELKIITSKPVLPEEEEIASNPRARSAKLRVAEKI